MSHPKDFRRSGTMYAGFKFHVVMKEDSEHIMRMVSAQANKNKKKTNMSYQRKLFGFLPE